MNRIRLAVAAASVVLAASASAQQPPAKKAAATAAAPAKPTEKAAMAKPDSAKSKSDTTHKKGKKPA